MTRMIDESAEQWRQRLVEHLHVLQLDERRHWERLGFEHPRVPGTPRPAIDKQFHETIERAKEVESELKEADLVLNRERSHLDRLLNYAREHLAEHDLTAGRVAAANDISVRYLYKVCADIGLSFEQWIITERLDRIRAELAAPGGHDLPIFAVAWAWGFADPRHFSRRFRDAYGVTPREFQAAMVPSE